MDKESEERVEESARLVLQQYERKILSLNVVSSKPAQGLAHIRLYIVKIFFYSLGKHHPNWSTISDTGITDLFREFRACLEEKSKRAKLSLWMFCNYSQCLEDFLEWWSSIIPSWPKILKKNVEVYLTHLKQFGLQHITEAEVPTSCCIPTVGLVKEVVESRFMKWVTKEIFSMQEPDAIGPPLMLGIIFIRLLLEVENGQHTLLALSIGDFKRAGGSDVVKIAGVTYHVLKVSLRSSTFPNGTARLHTPDDVWKTMHQYCSLVRPARVENRMKRCGVNGIPPSEFFLDERGDSLSSDFISKEFTDAWWLCGGGRLSPRRLTDFICGIIKSGTDHPVMQMYKDVLLQHALEASDNLRKGIDVSQADFANDKHAEAMERWRSTMKEFYELKEKYLASLKTAPFGHWEDFYKENRRKRLPRTRSPPWQQCAGQRSDVNADFGTPRQRCRRFLVFEPTVQPSQDNPEGSDPSDDTSNIGTASHADCTLDNAAKVGTPGSHPQSSDDEAESETNGRHRILEGRSDVGTPSDAMSNTGAILMPYVGNSGSRDMSPASLSSSEDDASGTVGDTSEGSSAGDKSASRSGDSSAALRKDTETQSSSKRRSSSEENASDGIQDDERDAGVLSRSPSPRERSGTLSDIEDDDELHEARQIVDRKGVAPVNTEPLQMPVNLVNYTFFGQCRKQALAWEQRYYGDEKAPTFLSGYSKSFTMKGDLPLTAAEKGWIIRGFRRHWRERKYREQCIDRTYVWEHLERRFRQLPAFMRRYLREDFHKDKRMANFVKTRMRNFVRDSVRRRLQLLAAVARFSCDGEDWLSSGPIGYLIALDIEDDDNPAAAGDLDDDDTGRVGAPSRSAERTRQTRRRRTKWQNVGTVENFVISDDDDVADVEQTRRDLADEHAAGDSDKDRSEKRAPVRRAIPSIADESDPQPSTSSAASRVRRKSDTGKQKRTRSSTDERMPTEKRQKMLANASNRYPKDMEQEINCKNNIIRQKNKRIEALTEVVEFSRQTCTEILTYTPMTSTLAAQLNDVVDALRKVNA